MPSVTTHKLARLVEAQRNRNAPAPELALAVADLIPESEPARFERSEVDQFRRSTQQLVDWLRTDLETAPPKLANLRRLVAVVSKAKPELPAQMPDGAPGKQTRHGAQNHRAGHAPHPRPIGGRKPECPGYEDGSAFQQKTRLHEKRRGDRFALLAVRRRQSRKAQTS